MKTFRALCAAAVLGLLVGAASPQGERGRGHNEGQQSGGSGRGGENRGTENRGGGGSQTNGGNRGGENRGGGSSGGSVGPTQGSGGNRGGGSTSGGGLPDRGVGHRYGDTKPATGPSYGGGRGDQDINRGRGGGQTGGGPSSTGGQNSGGNRGGGTTGGSSSGGNRGGGSIGGGSNSGGQNTGGGRGDGGLGRGGGAVGGGTSGGGTIGGGSSSTGSQGGWRGRGGNDVITVGSGGQSGRVDDSLLGRKGGRNGGSQYGTNNNVSSITRVGGTVVIGRAPIDLRSINKRDHILRRDNVQLNVGGLRVGYYFYDTRWCDDYFWYPWYIFSPWDRHCVASPWYYYPMLPPYVAWDRCHFYSFDPWNIWVGNPYQWQRPSYYGNSDYYGTYRGREVDYAVDDIVNAFERADRRAAARLVPERSEVAIYIDGRYSYSLNSDDFYDMFMDATQNTKTRRYEIVGVESSRDFRDVWRVTARHSYEDPWGRITSVIHYYELRYEGRNLVISKFGVSGEGF